jgi:pimeloyl-ACP methyl ester carboxylesterase
MREETLLIGPRRALIGVVTSPSALERIPTAGVPAESQAAPPAVLLLNAGILHRIGPNRTYVKIARSLAGLGYPVLRFDFSGIGDSPPRDDTLPFEQAALDEVQQAITTLHTLAGSDRFVLIGLCSGAQISLQAALADRRVVGAVLINATMHLHDRHDEELSAALRNRALLHHYRRLILASSFGPKTLLKTLTGNLNWPLLAQAARGFRARNPLRSRQAGPTPRDYALAQLQTLSARGVRVLHIYSEGDEGLDYFRLVLGKEAAAQTVELIRGANHTFTPRWSQERLVQVICDWARSSIPDSL